MVATTSWAELAADFRVHLVSRDSSPETIKSYLAYSKLAYTWFSLRDLDVVTADKRSIATFIEQLGRKYAKNSIRNFTSALRAFYKFCIASGLRKDDPTETFSVRKPRQQPKRPYSQDEVQAMKDAASAPGDLALLMLLLGTGIRIGGAVKLMVENIDFDREVALIVAKGGKEEWVALTPPVCSSLKNYIGERTTGPVLRCEDGRPMGRERARKRLVALGERAGVVNVYPHRFRVTFANHFLQAGGDLQALQDALGHADISTTAHYAGFTKSKRAHEQTRRFNMTLDLT